MMYLVVNLLVLYSLLQSIPAADVKYYLPDHYLNPQPEVVHHTKKMWDSVEVKHGEDCPSEEEEVEVVGDEGLNRERYTPGKDLNKSKSSQYIYIYMVSD